MGRRIRRVMQPDAQARLTVGSMAADTRRFAVDEQEDGSIVLTPTELRTVEVDARGRITMTGLVIPGEMYEVRREQDGSLHLTPVALTPVAGQTVRVHGGFAVAPSSEEGEA